MALSNQHGNLPQVGMVRKPKTGDRTAGRGKTPNNNFKLNNKGQSASAPQDKSNVASGPMV
jgi:hypothetical protein